MVVSCNEYRTAKANYGQTFATHKRKVIPLRITSHFLVGAARLQRRHTNYLLTDVQALLSQMTKSFQDSEPDSNKTLPPRKCTARLADINITDPVNMVITSMGELNFSLNMEHEENITLREDGYRAPRPAIPRMMHSQSPAKRPRVSQEVDPTRQSPEEGEDIFEGIQQPWATADLNAGRTRASYLSQKTPPVELITALSVADIVQMEQEPAPVLLPTEPSIPTPEEIRDIQGAKTAESLRPQFEPTTEASSVPLEPSKAVELTHDVPVPVDEFVLPPIEPDEPSYRARKHKRVSDRYRELTDEAILRQLEACPPKSIRYGQLIRSTADQAHQPEPPIPLPLFRIRRGKIDLPPPVVAPFVPRFKDLVPVNLMLRRPGCVKPSFERSGVPLARPLVKLFASRLLNARNTEHVFARPTVVQVVRTRATHLTDPSSLYRAGITPSHMQQSRSLARLQVDAAKEGTASFKSMLPPESMPEIMPPPQVSRGRDSQLPRSPFLHLLPPEGESTPGQTLGQQMRFLVNLSLLNDELRRDFERGAKQIEFINNLTRDDDRPTTCLKFYYLMVLHKMGMLSLSQPTDYGEIYIQEVQE
ncbi:hypothetical protein WDU94_009236 [Cyamophila willieti]